MQCTSCPLTHLWIGIVFDKADSLLRWNLVVSMAYNDESCFDRHTYLRKRYPACSYLLGQVCSGRQIYILLEGIPTKTTLIHKVQSQSFGNLGLKASSRRSV